GRNLCFPCRVGIAGRAGASGDNRRPSRRGLFHRLRTGRAAELGALEPSAAVHLKPRLLIRVRGLLNEGRDADRDPTGDWLEMGHAAGFVNGAASLEPAASGFVFCEEQDLQITLADEVQQKVEGVVDAEVVEVDEG